MTASATTVALLVGQTLLGAGNLGAASRRAGRVDTGEALIYLVIAGGLIAAVCVAIAVATRIHRQRRRKSHAALFRGLCQLHGLDRRARRLLKQLARHYQLAQPARLFCEPKWLDPTGLRSGLRQRASEVTALRNRLFG